MRLAFVVQRYGEEVAGGAESLCRATARALAKRGEEVTVLTTTARDYITWAPHYRPGRERDGAVEVRRFPALRPDPRRASALLRELALGRGSPRDEVSWALAQGPVAPGLLRALAGGGRDHDLVVIWTYLYATAQLAMPLVRERAVLVPLAHDEPMLRFGLTRGLVRSARALAFLTPEERGLVDEVHGIAGRPERVVGTGLAPAPEGVASRARRDGELPDRFVLYLGRVDPAKGVDALVQAHGAYRAGGRSTGLVLAGRPAGAMRLPPWVRVAGWVDAGRRADLLAAADAVVLPSPLESLSLAALEAWAAGTPTLATTRSPVLVGQTARSGAGLLYANAAGYARALSRMDDAALRVRLGAAGRRFVAPLTWDACVARWRELLAAAASA